MAEDAMARMSIEVVFALPDSQRLKSVLLPAGASAAEAIHAAGLSAEWRDEQGTPRPLARFGRLIAADTLLMGGDRVEILRPLLADPKDQRRDRVRATKKASARARSGG